MQLAFSQRVVEKFEIFQQFPLWKKGVQMVKRMERIEGLKRIFF
jgi:hypothetical protein